METWAQKKLPSSRHALRHARGMEKRVRENLSIGPRNWGGLLGANIWSDRSGEKGDKRQLYRLSIVCAKNGGRGLQLHTAVHASSMIHPAPPSSFSPLCFLTRFHPFIRGALCSILFFPLPSYTSCSPLAVGRQPHNAFWIMTGSINVEVAMEHYCTQRCIGGELKGDLKRERKRMMHCHFRRRIPLRECQYQFPDKSIITIAQAISARGGLVHQGG